ncbi:TPA: transmembrane anchored protein [Escherichia coli]
MKKAFAALFVLLSLVASTQAFSGRCQHDSDTAADGSRCGGRSADSRPGGGGIR